MTLVTTHLSWNGRSTHTVVVSDIKQVSSGPYLMNKTMMFASASPTDNLNSPFRRPQPFYYNSPYLPPLFDVLALCINHSYMRLYICVCKYNGNETFISYKYYNSNVNHWQTHLECENNGGFLYLCLDRYKVSKAYIAGSQLSVSTSSTHSKHSVHCSAL